MISKSSRSTVHLISTPTHQRGELIRLLALGEKRVRVLRTIWLIIISNNSLPWPYVACFRDPTLHKYTIIVTFCSSRPKKSFHFIVPSPRQRRLPILHNKEIQHFILTQSYASMLRHTITIHLYTFMPSYTLRILFKIKLILLYFSKTV